MKTIEEILEVFVNISEEIRHGRAIVAMCETCPKGQTQEEHAKVHLYRAFEYLELLPEHLTRKKCWDMKEKPFVVRTELKIVFP